MARKIEISEKTRVATLEKVVADEQHPNHAEAVAELERRTVAVNDAPATTQETLAAKKPSRAKKAVEAPKAPTKARLDRKVVDLILELRQSGLGVVRIARELEKRGIKTATGKPTWHGPNIRQILNRELGDEQWQASIASVKSIKAASPEPVEDESLAAEATEDEQ